jgi:MFS family permease
LTIGSTIIAPINKLQVRIAVSVFFFCQGLAFANWASRIPDIKTSLHLSEAGLGSILLALPVGQLLTMPFSGRLVTRFGSKYVLRVAVVGYVLSLTNIGLGGKAMAISIGSMCIWNIWKHV